MDSDGLDCVGGCGRKAPVFSLFGHRIPLRYCEECGDREAAAELVRDRADAVEDALRRSGATPRLLEQSLATYPADAEEPVAVARAWLDGYAAGERKNLWLAGPVGTGKTGLAWGIVRELAVSAVDRFYAADEEFRGSYPAAPAFFVNWRDLLSDLREEIRSGGEWAAQVYGRAERVAVLALDDLGAERPTPFAIEQLGNLVEARYQARRPTIVTSNFGTREFTAYLGKEDERMGERIVSRLLEGASGYVFTGTSRRRRAAT